MEKTFADILGALLVAIVFSFLCSLPVMLLWNHVLLDLIPGTREASWLQAWGLSILCQFLFKTPKGGS